MMKRSNGHVADARIAITAVNPAPLLVQGAGEIADRARLLTKHWRKRSATWRREPPSR